MANIKSSQASATVFGFQFQINVAIYLMLKYFSEFISLEVEGKTEDIELELRNDKKIYAQAKSKEFPLLNNDNHADKLKDALRTLSSVKLNNNDNLIYVSNLEENPLNSKTNEFDGITFLNYNELKDPSKKKIDIQIESNNFNIDKSKLIIAKIPFYGDDSEQRHKEITKKLESFISEICPDLINFSNKILTFWEADFLQNAATKNNKFKINKENVVWGIIVCRLQTDDVKKFDNELEISEEDYFNAIDKYEKVIDMKSSNFIDYNKIIDLYTKYKSMNYDKNKKISDFLKDCDDEIYSIIFSKINESDIVLKACSKIIAKQIVLRSSNINSIKKGVENYANK